jgi:phosphohistidine phosphatase
VGRDPAKWPNDDRRPLSRKGLTQTKKAARGLVRITPPIDRLVTSAADRAALTAALVADALTSPVKAETWPELAPGTFPAPLFTRLNRSLRPGQEAVVVGHAPTLAEFVGMALSGDGIEVVHLTKGGAACVEFPKGVRPGAGRLVWLYTRKELAKGPHESS